MEPKGCVHKIPPLVPILSQMNPVHTVQPYFHKTHSNIIFPSMPSSSKWSLPFRLPDKNFVCIFSLSCAAYMLHLSHPQWKDIHYMHFILFFLLNHASMWHCICIRWTKQIFVQIRIIQSWVCQTLRLHSLWHYAKQKHVLWAPIIKAYEEPECKVSCSLIPHHWGVFVSFVLLLYIGCWVV
jgi:hypothetical protein